MSTKEQEPQEERFTDIEIELDDDTLEYLNSAAAKEGIDVNTFINRLLIQHLERLNAEQADG